jgi:hypothetical protein
MKLWRNLLIGGFLLAFILLLGFFNTAKPRILVLHSGAAGSPWVEQVDRGMREALEQNRRPLSMEWHYMGVATPGTARGGAQAAAEARRAIERFKPDVLIAVDDEANTLVARDYVGRAEPRILYVSIDRPPAAYGYADAPNVSGIAEQLPWKALREALIQMFPDRAPTMAVLGAEGMTDQAELAQLMAFEWGPVRVGDTALVSTADAWRDFTVRASGADVLLVLGTQDLPDIGGDVVTAAELSDWTQANARPLPIGTQVDFVDGGGALSFSPPPDDYGDRAIRLALDWLDDRTTPGAPPPVESSHFEVAIRQDALARRGVTLPQIYLEAARENGTLFP